jgi:16S rRNA pseudouridine516 synthase
MRLDRFLCELNLGTRTQVKKEIKAGLVSVNGVTVLRPEEQVREAADLVCYKGQPCDYEEYVYYLLHKPAGVVSATQDKRDRTVLDLLAGEGRSDLFPVGRLDKEYECHLAHTFDDHQRELLEQGVDIGEQKKCRPAVVRILAEKKITLTITEGRFHQVKRMLHAVGNEVVYLKRIRMDRLQLEDSLEKGAYRRLTDEEVESLRGG